MSDRLLNLQHAIKAFLLSKDYFSDAQSENPVPIPVVTEDFQDVGASIEYATVQARGLCVLIRTPGGKIPSANHATAVYDPAIVHIRVYENPVINRETGGTRQAACKVADAIVRLIYAKGNFPNCRAPLVPKSRAWGTEEDLPFYDLLFETIMPLDPAEPTREETLLTEDDARLLDEFGNPITT